MIREFPPVIIGFVLPLKTLPSIIGTVCYFKDFAGFGKGCPVLYGLINKLYGILAI